MKKRMLFAAAIAVACIGAADPSYRVEPVENGAVVFNAHPDVSHQDCYNDPNHDAADLCAQWRAATAAEEAAKNSGWANWIAGLGLLLSAVGMIGLFVTVYFTRESLKEARKAADAAEAAVRETQRIGEAQTRCYLMVERAKVCIDKATWRPKIGFTVKNCGSSPALSLHREFLVRFGDGNAWTAQSDWEVRGDPTHLAPASRMRHTPVRAEFEVPVELRGFDTTSPLAMGVIIKITATDVFGDEQVATANFVFAIGQADSFRKGKPLAHDLPRNL